MKRLAEILVFTGLAVAAHLWLLGAHPAQTGGDEGAGDGGEALLTLAASTASIERMVADWDRPPETAPQPGMTAPDEVPVDTPAAIARPLTPLPKLPQVAGLALPVAEPAVKVDTEPPLTPAPEIAAAPPAAFDPPQPPEPAPDVTPDRDSPPAITSTPRPQPAQQPDAMPAPLPEPGPAPEAAKPAETQSKASPASVAQKAAGQGGGGSAGASAAPSDAAAKAKADKLLSRWGAQIRSRIERNKRPPREARGESGTVVLRVVVGRDGSLRGVSVARSSGIAALDQAAVGAVQRGKRFPAAPKGLQQPSYTISLTVRFGR